MVFTFSQATGPASSTTTTKTTTTYTSTSGAPTTFLNAGGFPTTGTTYVTSSRPMGMGVTTIGGNTLGAGSLGTISGIPGTTTTTISGIPGATISGFPAYSSGYTTISGQPMFTSTPVLTATPLITTPGGSYQYTSTVTSGSSGFPAFPRISVFRPTTTTTTMAPIAFGRISTTPLVPHAIARANRMELISPTSAAMQLNTGEAFQQTSRQSSAAAFESSSSVTINGVQCAGHLVIQNNKIVQAKNLFCGVAPFVLNPDTLEVTPDMTVVVRNPDIRVHIPDLPCGENETLTVANLKEMMGTAGEVYVGLPGEESKIMREEGGVLTLV